MGLFKKKHWTEKLDIDPTIKAQARARYDRHVDMHHMAPESAERLVRAWACQEQMKLDRARANDGWLQA